MSDDSYDHGFRAGVAYERDAWERRGALPEAARELAQKHDWCPACHRGWTWHQPKIIEIRQQQNLVTFFKWAMQEGPWEGGDLDGGGIQDKAESLGLIVKTKFDPAKHRDPYNDHGEGDDWYEFAPGLSDTSQLGKPR